MKQWKLSYRVKHFKATTILQNARAKSITLRCRRLQIGCTSAKWDTRIFLGMLCFSSVYLYAFRHCSEFNHPRSRHLPGSAPCYERYKGHPGQFFEPLTVEAS
ncbi:hypothetical protein CPC08DRAFT_375002 [Agrocybe pediades]|nr:hypothetical protein CPC08DRAFT_375002 [Agrocybe pediades]